MRPSAKASCFEELHPNDVTTAYPDVLKNRQSGSYARMDLSA